MFTREEIRQIKMSNEVLKEIRKYCRTQITQEERILLKDCCEQVDYLLTDFMLLNICEGRSYDKMFNYYEMPRCREDFYLRCRLALYLFIKNFEVKE